VNALGATFKPGAHFPFALASQWTFARLHTFLVKAFQPFRFFQRNDSYSDSLYVLRSILTLVVVPI